MWLKGKKQAGWDYENMCPCPAFQFCEQLDAPIIDLCPEIVLLTIGDYHTQ